jgi:hypothetical protein
MAGVCCASKAGRMGLSTERTMPAKHHVSRDTRQSSQRGGGGSGQAPCASKGNDAHPCILGMCFVVSWDEEHVVLAAHVPAFMPSCRRFIMSSRCCARMRARLDVPPAESVLPMEACDISVPSISNMSDMRRCPTCHG